jgi:WD40 repeat protein
LEKLKTHSWFCLLQYLHLYDARNYAAGAFAELKVPQNDIEKAIRLVAPDRSLDLGVATWNSIAFNTSGNQLLITADQGLCLLLDGFEGTVQRALVSSKPTSKAAVACFTPDDRTVLAGNENGTISCWNAETGGLIKTLEGHLGPVGCIAANPKYAQLASSCTNTALWIW